MSRRTRRRFLGVASAASVAALAGCGGVLSENDDPDAEADFSLPSAEPEVEVGMGGRNVFDPKIVRVEVGGTVTWVNESGNHSATAYHPDNDRTLRIPEDAEPWDSSVLVDRDATFEHTFEEPGVYDYYCTPHETLAMVGTVVVGDPDPDPDDQPGLRPPGEDFSGGTADELESLNEKVESGLA
ncbi:plastocyanin/azurin family copper-binding protein [Halorussus salilacus]|uniref:plastocyanin/azurin family copper-binding protein n=1 Tax=Halorussus salilacus TaxID=2953750 RepID=UPI0020A02D3D|nr:plastocyanin/azurin family copper-binding protein [Halorussus salilacus]USZ69242.1 plastocyanin/azurin family copper-binding protein [Halorussus salilacus]